MKKQETAAEKHFTLAASHGLVQHVEQGARFDLDFLDFDARGADNHIFFDNPQAAHPPAGTAAPGGCGIGPQLLPAMSRGAV